MSRRRGRGENAELLAPCSGRVIDDRIMVCGSCPVPCSALEDTARYLTDRLADTWARINDVITARHHELDDLLDTLAGMAPGGADLDGGRRIRALVASPSQRDRVALSTRMAEDPRFILAGEASDPVDVVPLAATALPDLVLVHLPDLAGASLETLAELRQWAPNAVVVVVSGLDGAQCEIC